MDIVVLALTVVTAAVQLYLLVRLPAPKLPDAAGKLRQQPGSVGAALATATVLLLILVFISAGMLQDGGGWRIALILWSGSLLFLLMGAPLALNGICYSRDGFAMRDVLGRVRTYCWTDVLAAERLVIPRRGRGFDMEITAVYLPDRTLPLRRTLEGTEQPFLSMLMERRPDLTDKNPDGRRVYSAWPSLAVSVVIGLFLISFAIAGMAAPIRYGWLWILVVLWMMCFLLLAAVALWPKRFPSGMREKLLGPEPRRKG